MVIKHTRQWVKSIFQCKNNFPRKWLSSKKEIGIAIGKKIIKIGSTSILWLIFGCCIEVGYKIWLNYKLNSLAFIFSK